MKEERKGKDKGHQRGKETSKEEEDRREVGQKETQTKREDRKIQTKKGIEGNLKEGKGDVTEKGQWSEIRQGRQQEHKQDPN